jgi:hypothetical protein
MSDLAPKRRCFQLGLMRLLVAVAIVCVCLAWLIRERSIVNERRAIIDMIVSDGGAVGSVGDGTRYRPEVVSWFRECMGDQAIPWIALKHGSSDANVASVKAAFPEANVGAFELPIDTANSYVHP